MKRILCLRLPHWPAQRLLADEPNLRGRPILLQQRSARGDRVVSCCMSAARAGITPRMPVPEALALLGAKSNPTVLPYDPDADVAALGRLAVWCKRFSPHVGWETISPRTGPGTEVPWYGIAPEHLLLDVTGIPQLFGGETAFVNHIITECRQRGVIATIGLAETVGAAWALAECADCTVVPPGEVKRTLAPLPVASLRLPLDVLHALERLGVWSIEQLMQLSRTGLAERFGTHAWLRLDQALGDVPELIRPHRPGPRFEAACQLELPTDRRDCLDWLISQLITRLTAKLRARDRGAIRLQVWLNCGEGGPVQFAVALFRPTDSPTRLGELLRLRFEQLALPGAVEEIRLRADRTAPLRSQQGELFPDPGSVAGRQLAELAERLASRLGSDAVLRPMPVADALPERAWRYGEFSLGRAEGRHSARSPRARLRFEPTPEPLKPQRICPLLSSSGPLPQLSGPLPPCGGGIGWGVEAREGSTPHPNPPPHGGWGPEIRGS
ncbi:MAG: hypothetical protein ACJ8C4_03205, partial [Gemmataceae bacterium]